MVWTAGQANLIEPVSFVNIKGIRSDIHEVYETETERSQQSMKGGSTSLDENGRRVECDNVDCSRDHVRTLYKTNSNRVYLLPHIC